MATRTPENENAPVCASANAGLATHLFSVALGPARLHSAFGEMNSPQRMIVPATSFVVAAVAVFVFLTLNEPETVPPAATRKFGWLVLCPAAFILAVLTRFGFWLSGLAMIFGVMVGASVRFLTPPLQSNIWPIAAVIWTALLLLPILIGSLVGGLGRWCVGRARTQ